MLLETASPSASVARPDLDVLTDVEDALWNDDTIRVHELDDLRVDVRDGEAFLSGHMSNGLYYPLIEDIVGSVPGVRVVHNRIVADRDLQIAVAQALAMDPRTRAHLIRVGVDHGWIHLGGVVPDQVTREAVEAVAASVPNVRGVTSLPRLPGESAGPTRRAFQPRIGEHVNASDSPAGQVAHVVIDPRNRLVSHIVVDRELPQGDYLFSPEVRRLTVVPVEAIGVISEGGVFLSDSSAALDARPTFNEADFQVPPPDWQPPFPYSRAKVLLPAAAPQ